MGVYLDKFPGALEPRRTPFDDAGKPEQPRVFIYMTNRYEDRWSYLMVPGFETVNDPANFISVGYTQLWIMEKLLGVHPAVPAKKARKPYAPVVPKFDKGVDRDDYMTLFHVLREPSTDVRDHNDLIGGYRKSDDALRYATDFANRFSCRTVVAKFLHDWQWH